LREAREARRFSTDHSRNAAWSMLLCACSGEAGRRQLAGLFHSPPNWDALLSLADRHGVNAHLAEALKGFAGVPGAVQQELQRRRRAQALAALAMTADLFRILTAFQKTNIEALAIKGPVLSMRAYGDPGIRHYGDLDFLIRSSDAERATQILAEAGYAPRVPLSAIRAGRVPGEYLFEHASTGMLAELHTEQSLRYFPKALPVEEYFARQCAVEIDSRGVPALSPEDEVVHICIHGSKHLWERLAWIADVAAILRGTSALDWNLVMQSADRTGASRMLVLGAVLATDLLGAPLPPQLNRRDRDRRLMSRVAAGIEQRLPAATSDSGIWKRAAYRVATGGGGASGLRYFCRVAFSTTEKDWPVETSGAALPDSLARRLLRLARLYSKRS